MRARVDCCRGSIFDRRCDLLVIPWSTDGTAAPGFLERIRIAGLPLPGEMRRGEVAVLPSANSDYGAVAYVGIVTGQTTSDLIIEGIGRKLGLVAEETRCQTISAPVVGAGLGELTPPVAAAALARGFQSTAPEIAELWICIPDRETLQTVTTRLLGLVPSDPADNLGRSTSVPASSTVEEAQRRFNQAVDLHRGHYQNFQTETPPVESGPTPSTTVAPDRKSVFISYSRADAEWLERLQKHLKPLQREGVHVWSDTRLKPGEPWREEIRDALAETKVAILLISADFLASDFIVNNELPPLLKAAEEDGATILPVIVSASRFVRIESLARFQAVNDPAKPLMQMSRGNREKVLDQVACAVEDALKR